MYLEVLKYACVRTQQCEASWALSEIAFYFTPTQQLQMVLANHTGKFPLTLAKFMSTAQTTTVSPENPDLPLHGAHTSAPHPTLFPPSWHRVFVYLVSVLGSSGLRSILAQPSALVLMSCILTVQLTHHLLLWHSWLLAPVDEVFLAEQVHLWAVKVDDKLILELPPHSA